MSTISGTYYGVSLSDIGNNPVTLARTAEIAAGNFGICVDAQSNYDSPSYHFPWTIVNMGLVGPQTQHSSPLVGIKLEAGGKITNQGIISGYNAGILSQVNPATVNNLYGGYIGSRDDDGVAISLAAGGTVTNAGSIRYGIRIRGATATITNTGTIEAPGGKPGAIYLLGTVNNVLVNSGKISFYNNSPVRFDANATVINTALLQPGIYFKFGGVVTNKGVISGMEAAVQMGGYGTVINYGLIEGLLLFQGANVNNAQTALITTDVRPAIDAVSGGAVTITNLGTIVAGSTAASPPGIALEQGGRVTNGSSGVKTALISGFTFGVGDTSSGSLVVTNFGTIHGGAGTTSAGVGVLATSTANNTVTNFGTITGDTGTAVAFGSGNDLIVVNPSAVFGGGIVDGGTGSNTLELAAGAGVGVIQGLGTGFQGLGGSFVNFGVVSVDNGAAWIFQSIASGTINLGAAQVEFSGSSGPFTVDFTTGGATAKIDNLGLGGFFGHITGFQRGDVLDLPAVTGFSGTIPITGVSYTPGTLTLLNGSSSLWQISFTTPITKPVFSVTADGAGGISIHLEPQPLQDLNADGMSDITFQNGNGDLFLWAMNGTSILPASGGIGNPGPIWSVPGTGDFNGDGKSDILFQDSANDFYLWEMNGTTVLPASGSIGNSGPGWAVKGISDFNGDGKSDILLQNGNGDLFLWEMSGTAILPGSGIIGNPGPGWVVKGTGDFNGDGKSDILFQNGGGDLYLWEMNGTTVLPGSGAIGNPGPSWNVVATADFNGDGRADILFRNGGGDLFLWEMNGTTILPGSGAIGNPGPSWTVKRSGDFNGDGKSDILFQNGGGDLFLWAMNGTSILPTSGAIGNPGPSWHMVTG